MWQLPPRLCAVDAPGHVVRLRQGDYAQQTSYRADPLRLATDYAAAGGQRYGGKLMRGVSLENPPLRITELPKWVREHNGISTRTWKRKDVRTKSNCLACHVDAERGYYDE